MAVALTPAWPGPGCPAWRRRSTRRWSHCRDARLRAGVATTRRRTGASGHCGLVWRVGPDRRRLSLPAILGVAWLIEGAWDRRRGRLRSGWWRPLAVLAFWRWAFVAFNEWTGGRPLPNTFYAKNYGMGTAVSLAEGRPLDALLDVARYPLNLLGDAIRWQACTMDCSLVPHWRACSPWPARWAQPAPRGGEPCSLCWCSRPWPRGWSRLNPSCSSTMAAMSSTCSCSGWWSARAVCRPWRDMRSLDGSWSC